MLVAAYRRYIRFLKLSALFETSSYSAGISQCLFCKTSAGRRNAEYEIDSTGSVVRDATRTGSGGIIGAFRLRSQRRDGSELAKSAGRRNAEYEIDSTGSVVRDATRTGSGGIIGAFRLRSQRRDGSELAKSAGCLCVYRMRQVHRGLSGEHHREKTISP